MCVYVCVCSVHLRVAEKLDVVVGRDGGVQNMELHGMILLRISDPECARIRVSLANNEKRPIQFPGKVWVKLST